MNTLTLTELLVHITNDEGTPEKEVIKTITELRNLSRKIAEKSIELGIENKVIKRNKNGKLISLIKSQF